MIQSTICIIIFFITIALYMSNKFPLALVSITSMTILTVTGCLAPEDPLANFANDYCRRLEPDPTAPQSYEPGF